MAQRKLHSIMKRQRSARRSEGLKWDEDNLKTNAQIVAELAPRKITEPKTPFRRADSEDGMQHTSGGCLQAAFMQRPVYMDLSP